MEFLAIGALAVAAIVLVAGIFLMLRARSGPADDGALERLREELSAAQRERNEAAEARARAETRLEAGERRLAEVTAERDGALALREASRKEAQEAQEQASLMRQRIADMEKRIADWEQAKKESIEAAKAGALASARELSAQLIEGHKRESEAAKKESEERVQKVTGELQQHFQQIVQSVHALSKDVDGNRSTVETVMRSLTNPGGAGQFAEIGLENTLKAFGLQIGRDFVMQHATTGTDGRGLRPDAVIFLPGDQALVVDSKASKFFMELAAAEGTEAEEEAYRNIARTMQGHLKALADKDYGTAIRDMYVAAGRGAEFRQVITAMYLPSEAAIEKLDRADPEFRRRATQHQIIPIGPSGLAGLIGLATCRIDLGRQAENQEKIVEATRQLLDSVVTALGYAEKVGNSLESAAKHFASFTKSVNSRLLPRSRTLVGLGVRPQKKGSEMKSLAAFEVTKFDASSFLEGEASEDGDDAASDENGLHRPRLVKQSSDE